MTLCPLLLRLLLPESRLRMTPNCLTHVTASMTPELWPQLTLEVLRAVQQTHPTASFPLLLLRRRLRQNCTLYWLSNAISSALAP